MAMGFADAGVKGGEAQGACGFDPVVNHALVSCHGHMHSQGHLQHHRCKGWIYIFRVYRVYSGQIPVVTYPKYSGQRQGLYQIRGYSSFSSDDDSITLLAVMATGTQTTYD